MISAPCPVAYLLVVTSAVAAILPPRSYVEDKELRNAPIISIVDDDESVRSALGSLVRSHGLGACTFGSAEEFLQSPHVDGTSCLITDLQMPGLSGVELQSLLLARGYHMPIIIVTAFPEEPIKLRAMDAGALGFLCKPFESRVLLKLIDTALATGRDT